MYRYKLKNKVNQTDSVIIIDNHRFHSNSWKYSENKLDLKGFSDQIIEEEAATIESFRRKDKAERKKRFNTLREKGKIVIEEKKIQKEKTRKSIRKMVRKDLFTYKESELKNFLDILGFAKKEYQLLNKAKLIDLILIERKIYNVGKNKKKN